MTQQSKSALERTNFFVADVRDGLGPYLGIYLLTQQHWDAGSIGVVLSMLSIATLVVQTPVGAFIDVTSHKRLVISIASLVVGIACVGITLFPTFLVVSAGQVAIGVAGAVFQPAIAAITLGLCGPGYFARQVGRNEAFNHAGNVFTALLSGAVGYYISTAAIFYQVAILGAISAISILGIRRGEIDHAAARGSLSGEKEAPSASGFRTVLLSPTLLVFAVSVLLFHFANAAMLPLIGERLSIGNEGISAVVMSACIIEAQLVMVPMAIIVGRKVDSWGRKPLFLLGFAVLPLRGALYTFSADPYYLLAVQSLDGIGAGIFGALFPIVLADLTRGTGRYNVVQGAVLTLMGIGVSLSNLIAGFVAKDLGFDAAFLFLSGVAVLAFALYLFAMPETRPAGTAETDREMVPGFD